MSKPPVIDIHAHYYPESYMQALSQYGYPYGTVYSNAAPADAAAPGATSYKRPDSAFTDLGKRIAAMDQQGVTMQALSVPSPWVFWKDSELATVLARAYNDAASAAHVAHPGRLVGLATLPMHDPNLALTELERAARLPGMRGVGLGTHAAGRELSDRMFFPVYERIAALGLPIFLHYAPLTVIGGNDRLKQRQRGTFVRYGRDLHPGHGLEQLAGEMIGGALAGGSVIDLAGPGLRQRDQFLDRVGRDRWMNDGDGRRRAQHRDRREAAHGIECEFALEVRTDRHRRRA